MEKYPQLTIYNNKRNFSCSLGISTLKVIFICHLEMTATRITVASWVVEYFLVGIQSSVGGHIELFCHKDNDLT